MTHIEAYPLKLEQNNPNRAENDRVIRDSSIKKWKDDARSVAAKISFSRDSARLWNRAPIGIKNALTLSSAKKEIKSFCDTLEV